MLRHLLSCPQDFIANTQMPEVKCYRFNRLKIGEVLEIMAANFPEKNQALNRLLEIAAHASPYYQSQTWAKRLRAGVQVNFPEDIPVTQASEVKQKTEKFFTKQVPDEDGRIVTKYTSGSTGEPTQVHKTMRHFQLNSAENSRLASDWYFTEHKRTMSVEPPDSDNPAGHVKKETLPDGTLHFSHYGNEFSSVLDCLIQSRATRFQSITSVVYNVLALARKHPQALSLRLAVTVGEATNPRIRDECEKFFGIRIFDTYGAVETGTIAVRCALCGEYHLADRHLVVEILKDDGSPAQVGETGRMILTPLFNAAMPLLRYEIGDLVEVSEKTNCPRSHFALRRIFGRERQMFKLADGRRVSPGINSSDMFKLGVRQYKLVQTALDRVELRYIPSGPENRVSQETAQALIDLYLDKSLRVKPVIVPELPRLANGKYFEHECHLT